MTSALHRRAFAGFKHFGFSEDDRRDFVKLVTDKDTMSGMGAKDLNKILAALEKRGFKPGAKPGKKRHPAAPRGDLRLCHILWRKLGSAGKLDRPDRAGLNTFVRSRFEKPWGTVPADIDMMRDHKQIAQIIEALKSWCRREGLEP